MPDDQAHGLRHLFARRRTRLLGVVGEDGTSLTLELALAFAGLAQHVLVLDRSCGEAARGLGLCARYELRHALSGEKPLRQVALDGPQGIVVLPAARALERMDGSTPGDSLHMCEQLDRELGPFDLMLVNGAPPALAEAGVLLALAPTSSALTEAYTELKKLSRRGMPRHCEIVVQRAGSEAAALDAFDSVAITAGRFLGMTLALAGTLPGSAGLPGTAGAFATAESARGRAVMDMARRLCAGSATRKAVNQ
jgi:flagellar biosynthesis protein FlhG